MKEHDEVVAEGHLFRLTHKPVEGRAEPYEFIQRRGAVTVLPITTDSSVVNNGLPHVLSIYNRRRGYEASQGLPGGNMDGPLDNQEHPTQTALRELREETGYGIIDATANSVSTFILNPISSTIDYPRYFSIVRGVQRVAEPVNDPNEIVEILPVPAVDYIDELSRLEGPLPYLEVKASMQKAVGRFGLNNFLKWIVYGSDPEGISDELVHEVVQDYMTPVGDDLVGTVSSLLYAKKS